MKTALIILSLLLISGCKTKKVLSTKSEEQTTEIISVNKNEEKQIQETAQLQAEKKIDIADQKKENQTDVEIKGKAEIDKPVELFHVENGDTLQAIKVTGKADVFIRTKTYNSSQVKTENTSESFTNKIEEISRNIVKEENLKKTGRIINNKAKEVTVRNGTFGSFALIGGLGVVGLVIIGLIIYFKKYRKS